MRILVTGGCGYVGKRFCRTFATSHDLCVVDSLRFGRDRLGQQVLDRVQLDVLDIRDRDALQESIARFKPEVIVHLAAIHFIPECEQQPDLAVSTNVLGTVNVASLCPPACRLVFASSGAVYQPQDAAHQEAVAPVRPDDVYGWSKLQGEQYVRYFAAKRGYAAGIVRLFNVVGPGETNPHLIPEIVAQLKAGQSTIRLGNLTAKRDYIHVDDVARGFMQMACAGEIPDGEAVIANLGTQQSYDVNEVLELLRTVSGIDLKVAQDPARMRASDRPFLAADNGVMRQRFGWAPQVTLRDALDDLWRDPDIPGTWIERYR